MKNPKIWLVAALVVFLAFIANVFVGASAGTVVVGRTGELLMMIAVSVLFVIGTLCSEARARSNEPSSHEPRSHQH
ncbi:hypothetical protein [Jiella mangrovi]|uniref:DUF1328 domain-containing protein n=1 Tax=Jiella mangrovi TaxID=2821407 RepID=A0ABS4BN37_9HYPH|nr:hypothetical protein [Jiella mangrovi]MBP0618152.1 hypothetical protein [Jiella mangrovi]